MPYGSLVVKFAADLAEFQRDVRRSSTIVERELRGIQRTAQGFQRAFQAAFVGTGLITFTRAIIREGVAAEESQKRLAATLRATGDATGFTTKQLDAMNAELTSLSRFDDEGIRNAQANLASFGNIAGDVFQRALRLSADLAERLGTDVADAATVLGKALTDTGGVDSIARGIIKLTEAEKARAKELLRLNDLQGYQNLLLKVAEERIGGTAQEMNTGLLKATSDLAKAWNDLLEEIAQTGIFERVTNTLRGAATLIRDIRDEIAGIPTSLRTLEQDLADLVLASPARFTFAGPWARSVKAAAAEVSGVQTQLAQEVGDQAIKAQNAWDMVADSQRKAGQEAEKSALGTLDAWRRAGEARAEATSAAAARGARAPSSARAAVAAIQDPLAISAKAQSDAMEAADQAAARQRAAAKAAAAKAEEEERRRAEIAKATAGLRVSIAIDEANRIAAAEERVATTRLDILERFYTEGLVSERDYWQTRISIQQDAIRSQLAAADVEIAQRRKAVAAAGADAKVTGAGAVAYLNAQKDLSAALEKRKTLEAELAQVAVTGNLDARAAARQYEDAIADVNAQLLELQGRSAEAAAIRFEQQTRTLRRQVAGDPAARQAVEDLERATIAQASFNDALRNAEFVQRDLALAEERINNSREAGAISEFQSLKQISAARKESLVQLAAIADEMENVAQQSGNVFLVQQAAAFRVEIEKLANQTDLLAQKFDKIGETAFADFLTDVLDDIRSVDEAFKRMIDSIVKQINRLASEEIANVLFKAIRGEGKGGGFGQILADIFGGEGDIAKKIAGVFGGGTTVKVPVEPVWEFAGLEQALPILKIPAEPNLDFAGVDANIPSISIPVEPPPPVDIPVNVPSAITIPVEQPLPVQIPVEPPATVSIPVEPPQSVSIPVEPPQAVSIPVEPPSTVTIPVEPPKAVQIPVEQPQAVSIPVEPPATVQIPVEQPAAVRIPVEPPAPVQIPVEPPQTVQIPVEIPKAVKIPVDIPPPIEIPVEPLEAIKIPVEEVPIPVAGVFKGLSDVPDPTEIPVKGIWEGMAEAIQPIKVPIEGIFKGLADLMQPVDIPVNGLFQGLAASGAGGMGYYAAADISNLFLAGGGRVSAGRAYVVGDGGEPEWFIPDTSGTVVPMSEMNVSSGRGQTIVNNFTVSGPVDRRSQEQIALAAGRGVQRSMERNG